MFGFCCHAKISLRNGMPKEASVLFGLRQRVKKSKAGYPLVGVARF